MPLKDLLQPDPFRINGVDLGKVAEVGPYKVRIWKIGRHYNCFVHLLLPGSNCPLASWSFLLTEQEAIDEAEKVLLEVDRWLAPRVGIEVSLSFGLTGRPAIERVLEEEQDF